MRVCIPLADSPQGGAYSFFRNFRKYLEERGVAFSERLDDEADVLMANSWVVPYRAVAGAKRAHPTLRVLHRIDGSARDYGRDTAADLRQALVNLLADVTVFQSAYGREVTRRRIIGQDGPVIHNPVDGDRFRPDGERLALAGTVRVAHVAFSTNPKKGSAAVYDLARRRPDVSFVMVGRYAEPPALANLAFLGYADWDRLPVILRSCHLLLFLSENETCPNVVLEAMASGLPVLYRPSGGTAELVGSCGLPVDPRVFDQALEEVMDRRAALAPAARQRAVGEFSCGVVFPRYLEAAGAAVRRPLPGPAARLAVLARVRPAPLVVARWLGALARRRRPSPAGAA